MQNITNDATLHHRMVAGDGCTEDLYTAQESILYGRRVLGTFVKARTIWLSLLQSRPGLEPTICLNQIPFEPTQQTARLPTHKVYTRFILLQNDIIEWSRDHRVHHKHSETDADPHNATRGFFFAHMGWLMVPKHPEVKEKGSKIDISDIVNDPVCSIQRK